MQDRIAKATEQTMKRIWKHLAGLMWHVLDVIDILIICHQEIGRDIEALEMKANTIYWNCTKRSKSNETTRHK